MTSGVQRALELLSHSLQVVIYAVLGVLYGTAFMGMPGAFIGAFLGVLLALFFISGMETLFQLLRRFFAFLVRERDVLENSTPIDSIVGPPITDHNFYSVLFLMILFVEMLLLHDLFLRGMLVLGESGSSVYDWAVAFISFMTMQWSDYGSREQAFFTVIIVLYMVPKHCQILVKVNLYHIDYLKNIENNRICIGAAGNLFVITAYASFVVALSFLIGPIFIGGSIFSLLLHKNVMYICVESFFYFYLMTILSENIKQRRLGSL